MPLDTKTYDLSDEQDRLREEREEYAQEQAEAPIGSDAAQQAAQLGQQADRFLSGIAWAIETWDVDSVTLSALTNGERRRVVDRVSEEGWATADCYVAHGTYDAPYLAHDPDAVREDDFDATFRNVTDLHPAYVDWAEQQISDLGGVGAGDSGKSYRELVLEKRTQVASQNESG